MNDRKDRFFEVIPENERNERGKFDIIDAIHILTRLKKRGFKVGDHFFIMEADDHRALELGIAALMAIANKRSDIAVLFDEVRQKEHEMLVSIYDSEKADEQLTARQALAKAFAELKERNLLTYYKLYDFALIVNGDASSILDMAAMGILPQ